MARDAAARRARLDALVDVVVAKYAPLTGVGVEPPGKAAALRRTAMDGRARSRRAARQDRLAHARVDGVDWYWPADENPAAAATDEAVRLLAPFDPVVWDRPRFELLWGWEYRFEAYTPVPKRKLGYYALPLLWRDRVVGWANVVSADGRLQPDFGYVAAPAARRAFRAALDEELARLGASLGVR